MATISGRVIFDRDRSATINDGDSGLLGVPVVLQNIETNERLAVLTDINGNYSFENVANGEYRLVESYGTQGAVLSPGNFELAVVGPIPNGENPPISIVINPPVGANNMDSLTPDTLYITVSGEDIVNQNFLNGPIREIPIQTILDACATVSEENLINAADSGTFGSFPAGTPPNTGVPVEPYLGVTPDYTYVLPNPEVYAPTGGEYTVQNIMNNALSQQIGAWWRIADHTTGNETGRMMVVNGYNPGSIFFTETVMVEPNTNYLFSSWILNLFRATGYANPQLGVVILDEEGNTLYSATLGETIPVNTVVPEWKEIGTVINSQNNTTLTVQFLSEGPEAIGNDYVIDDISLREIQVPIFTPVKVGSTSVANVGDRITYTISLENTCTSPLTNVFFRDNVPSGLEFIPDTATINGVSYTGVNPNIGFELPDIQGGQTAIVTFDVVAEFIPSPNPTINYATITYSYTPIEGGIENEYTVNSNEFSVNIDSSADVAITKTANTNPVSIGETLLYTINIINNGPSVAQNVVVTDAISSDILNSEFSIDGGETWSTWTGQYEIGTLTNGENRTILIRGTVANSASGTIINTVTVTSTTPDPDLSNNTDTVIIIVEGGAEQLADISVLKSAIPNPVASGEVLTYTVEVSNLGPSVAQNVVVTDAISSDILNSEFSIDGGETWSTWTGQYEIGTLTNGENRTILIRGTVANSASGTIINTATVTSTTPDPDLCNNSSRVVTTVKPSFVVADVEVIKKAVPNPIERKKMLTYIIKVMNNGPSVAQDVILIDNIPNSIRNPEFSIDGGETWNTWTGVYTIGTLQNNESRIILIRGKVRLFTICKIINAAVVTSTTLDTNRNNNISIAKVKIHGSDNCCHCC